LSDIIQQAMQDLATQNAVTRGLAIFCAVVVVYFLGASWAAIIVTGRARVTIAVVARVIALAVLAFVASTVLTGIVIDPRPYVVAHAQPLTPVGHDNGFPSDHTLLAATLAASIWWIDRRWLAAFAAGTVLVGLGRLGIGAHHTLDVAGSIAIAVVAAVIIARIPLPAAWDRVIVPRRGRAGAMGGVRSSRASRRRP